jgi:hypothetical protein
MLVGSATVGQGRGAPRHGTFWVMVAVLMKWLICTSENASGSLAAGTNCSRWR